MVLDVEIAAAAAAQARGERDEAQRQADGTHAGRPGAVVPEVPGPAEQVAPPYPPPPVNR